MRSTTIDVTVSHNSRTFVAACEMAATGDGKIVMTIRTEGVILTALEFDARTFAEAVDAALDEVEPKENR